jgi:hypothetical protein
MTEKNIAVFGIYSSHASVDNAVEALKEAGYIVGMTNGSELGTIVRELNLSSGTSGLVLVACSVLIIRGRRRIPTPIA